MGTESADKSGPTGHPNRRESGPSTGPPPVPEPDVKDWTWTLDRVCADCGFDAGGVERSAVPALVRDATSRFPNALRGPDATMRPAPTTWSVLEYA